VPECTAHAKSGAFACLQHMPLNMSELMTTMGMAVSTLPTEEHAFVPNFDELGGVYPLPGSLILARGQRAKIPFITGCNKEEGTAFVNAPQFVTAGSMGIDLLSKFTPSLEEYSVGGAVILREGLIVTACGRELEVGLPARVEGWVGG
jgi:acetylcholinesterase